MGSPPSDLVNRTKTKLVHDSKNTALWLLTLATSAIFIAIALPKLGGFGFFQEAFEQWGYPGWVELGVGILEFVGAVFLIIPTTAFFAAWILGAIMVGAVATHLVFGPVGFVIAPLLMLVVLVFIGWMRRPNALRTSQPPTSSPRTA